MLHSCATDAWWRWLLLSASVIALDLATKAWVVGVFREGEELPMTSFFSLVLAYNTGAAFSFLAGADGWQRWFFAGIAVVASAFLVWMLRRGGNRLSMCGFALILGGALGNLWDRVVVGRVIDFLLFHYAGWSWPAFNVADSAITVGAAFLIFDSFRDPPGAQPNTIGRDAR
ncbi:MAG: lipoprotein signal peptidase [Burkholderiales bacterium]|nr:lipoprotein signal peptidase [Burkholderiales bacterium]